MSRSSCEASRFLAPLCPPFLIDLSEASCIGIPGFPGSDGAGYEGAEQGGQGVGQGGQGAGQGGQGVGH